MELSFEAFTTCWYFFIVGAGALFGVRFLVESIASFAVHNEKDKIRTHTLKRLVEQKLCEYCNTVNVASARSCIKCQREFGTLSITEQTIETMDLSPDLRAHLNEGNVKVCHNCGRLNPPTYDICKRCNRDLFV